MTGIDCTVSMFPLFAHIQSLFIITYTQLFTGTDCTVSMFQLFAHVQSLFIITYTLLFTGTDCTVSMFPLFAHIQSLFIITYTQLPTAPMYHCFKVIPNTLCSASDAFYCLYHHSSILMPFIVGFPLHLFP